MKDEEAQPHPDEVPEADSHLGALEADTPTQPGQANRNVPALDAEGRPRDWQKICEDAIGANVDESEG
jgi:hypothetical protein